MYWIRVFVCIAVLLAFQSTARAITTDVEEPSLLWDVLESPEPEARIVSPPPFSLLAQRQDLLSLLEVFNRAMDGRIADMMREMHRHRNDLLLDVMAPHLTLDEQLAFLQQKLAAKQ